MYEVAYSITHQQFVKDRKSKNEPPYRNDIALVRLKRRIEYSREVAPVYLPSWVVSPVSPGKICMTAGWGGIKGGYQ